MQAGAELAGSAPGARLLTRCVPLGKADTHLDAPHREALAGSYADRAIALIRDAIERREPGAGRLLAAPEFEPLQFREAFKNLALLAPAREPAAAK